MLDINFFCEVYGIKGIIVCKWEDLVLAIVEMLVYNGFVVMDVVVKKDENCYFMIVFGMSNV